MDKWWLILLIIFQVIFVAYTLWHIYVLRKIIDDQEYILEEFAEELRKCGYRFPDLHK